MALDEALGGIEPHKSHTQVFPGKPLTGVHPCLDYTLMDYSHLDYTHLDYKDI